jgi:flagellar hook-associated protein 1 FlgK
MASPVSAVASSNNKGTLTLSSITALSGAGTHPSKTEEPPVITFKNSGSSYTYEIYRGESLVSEGVYTPSDPISYSEDSSSWTISLKGIPQDGDSFTIQSNSNFSLDSGNAQAILDLRDLNMFDGLRPLTDGYAMLVASVGVKVQSAKSSQQISTDVASSLDKQKSTVSGVNLDEEAARMIQYQQAYQAAGKMMQIAQSIFDTLLQGLGR